MSVATQAVSISQARRQLAALVARASSDPDVVAAIADLRALLANTIGGVDVHDYGAAGDGATDDTVAVQAAITAAGVTGGRVFLRAGTYMISAPLAMAAGVALAGEGMDVSVLKVVAGTADTVNPIIYARNVNGWSVRDVKLDGNATNLTQAVAHSGLYVSGCSRWAVERCRFVDIGKTALAHGGVHLYVTAYETADPQAILATDIRNVPSRDFRIVGCFFDDSAWKCDFGIRLWGNFDYNIADTAFATFVSGGVIEGCTFSGFAWNPVELASPAVRHNVIAECTSYGSKGFGGFCIDKGASYNRIIGCDVRDNVVVQDGQACYRVQGYPVGAQPQRYATGNAVIGCRASDLVVGAGAFECVGLWINNAKETTVTNFDAKDITRNGTADTEALRIEVAYDTVVQGGVWKNVQRGVYVGATVDRLRVTGVTAQCNYRFWGVAATGAHTFLEVAGCTITTAGAVIAIAVSDEDLRIIGNRIIGDATAGSVGISCAPLGSKIAILDNLIVSQETGVDASGGGIVDLTIRNNKFESCTTALSLSANAVRNVAVGNYDTGAGGSGRAECYGSAAPTTGTWKVGDVVWHSAPASGGNIGWVCTTAGTPGTWKSFGTIA